MVSSNLLYGRTLGCMCLRRYLVAVCGMALQQQRREQLDQALSVEDTALLEQKGVLEPAIPQPSGIRREAGAVVKGGGGIGEFLALMGPRLLGDGFFSGAVKVTRDLV
ncbi:hypothetical protein INR49_003015 [Caranx melampygus]|nr:hypothetical protein INR49_003015 [Caranx melampygus]